MDDGVSHRAKHFYYFTESTITSNGMTMILKKGTGCFKLPILVVVGVICMTVMLLNKEWFISEEAFTFDEIESKVGEH